MAKKRNGERQAALEFVSGLDERGRWIRLVRAADGTSRLPTRAESEEADRRWKGLIQDWRREFQECIHTALHDPEHSPPLDVRYMDYVRWKKGLAPYYRPTFADRAMLAIENIRETSGPPARANPRLTDDEESPAASDQDWMTVSDCARRLCKDIPRYSFETAKTLVSNDATKDKLKSNGKKGTNRRIEPTSFEAWLLRKRDRELDRVDSDR